MSVLKIERASEEPDDGNRVHLLSDLIARPELLAPPRAVVPRIAYEGRITLLSAPRKSGKSTLAGAAAAALSNGEPFLGQPMTRGAVLWGAFDEPLGDVVRRLTAGHAAAHRIYVAEPCSTLDLIVAAEQPGADGYLPIAMVVVDAVGDLHAHELESENDSSQVRRALAPLRAFARRTGIAVVLLHHTTKATGRARGAGAYEEVSDLLLTLSIPERESDPSLRRINAEGRVGVEDFDFRLGPESMLLADDEPTPMQLVEMAVFAKQPCSTRAILESVARNRNDVHTAIGMLANLGRIVNRGSRNKAQWCLPEADNTSGNGGPTALEPAPVTPRNAPVTPPITSSVFSPLGETLGGERSGVVA